jgi:hypothetical protein
MTTTSGVVWIIRAIDNWKLFFAVRKKEEVKP